MNRVLNLTAVILALAAGLASLAGGALAANSSPAPVGAGLWALELLLLLVIILPGIAYPAVGAAVIARGRSNAVAWSFLVIGLTWAMMLVAMGAREPSQAVGALAADAVFAWIASWTWMVAAGLAFAFIPLVYPNGSLLSPRWRPIALAAGVVICLLVLAAGFAPGPLAGDETIENPFAIHGVVGDLLGVVRPDSLGLLLLAAVTLTAVSSLVIRFRRSRGLERQQIKWLAYAAGVTAALLLTQVVTVLGPSTSVVQVPAVVADLTWILTIAGFASFAPAAGIAILRYRLYDIDLLINRTLVYAALTLSLGAVYVSSVIVLQGVLSTLAGGESLAVAASTLAVAAVFQPLRRRIQRGVDRRFYRSRYDAQRTLGAFSTRLRHEVDLSRLTDELRDAVDDTLQPASVSVWLKPSGPSEG